ncbi:hypothetical protein [Capnocytophaga sputigena]|uniref:hypothetical protein n=1 Tax=Capnocytophaga sputigena TaxID=1019 RepID=UPI0028E9DE07|nr:hypothetical protein [Capnocytophaga sputigena]
METVFKVGMEVYDQIYYPNQKGIIKKIHNNNSEIHFPIEVEFNGEIIDTYTLKGSCNYLDLITLSTHPYTLQGFEQKAPAPTYEEALKEAHSKGDYYYLPDSLEAPSEELVDATIALLKLLFLRDYYNEGWQPNWSKKNKMHFCIRVRNNKITTNSDSDINEFNTVLVFRDYTIRDKFFKEQKELLEIAKPLL